MPERLLNLVVPLAHEATAMRTPGTTGPAPARPGAVAPLIGPQGLRPGHVDSTTAPRTRATTPTTRTSTTATRTTTTRAPQVSRGPSADSTPLSFEALVQAWLDCRRTKRNSATALAFEQHAERHLVALHEELLSGAWQPGRTRCFVVTRPKPREVWAAPFRDRVVHWLLYNHVAPRFHAAFSVASCACIPGRGTLYALHRLEHDVRGVTANWARPAWYLKCDLANFFVAIDKHVLFALLARHIAPGWWRDLAATILFHDPRTDAEVCSRPDLMARVPAHKSLFNAPADTGLPIGNLSSQFFANVLLDALDQRVKHTLRGRRYVRYVDDFVLLHEDPAWLRTAHDDIAAWLPGTLHARLNERKTVLQPVARGIDFVGFVVKPWHTTTRRTTVACALARLEHLPAADVHPIANSYFGLFRQASHSHQERLRLARAVLDRGHCVNLPPTKAYR